jgi:release factor glutamine methyltransferase
VAGRVRVLHGDMFDALDAADRFDLVFWNSNVIEAPGDFTYERDLEYAIFDRCYEMHQRYLSQGPGRLGPQGRLMLGYNALGDRARLDEIAADHGLSTITRERLGSRTGNVAVEFTLLELLATADAEGSQAGAR